MDGRSGFPPVCGVPPGALAGQEHGFFVNTETGRPPCHGRGGAEKLSDYIFVSEGWYGWVLTS